MVPCHLIAGLVGSGCLASQNRHRTWTVFPGCQRRNRHSDLMSCHRSQMAHQRELRCPCHQVMRRSLQQILFAQRPDSYRRLLQNLEEQQLHQMRTTEPKIHQTHSKKERSAIQNHLQMPTLRAARTSQIHPKSRHCCQMPRTSQRPQRRPDPARECLIQMLAQKQNRTLTRVQNRKRMPPADQNLVLEPSHQSQMRDRFQRHRQKRTRMELLQRQNPVQMLQMQQMQQKGNLLRSLKKQPRTQLLAVFQMPD
mmetsp:Transcript_9871/g.30158  ORF Transcript_9871/g.30158 Transcript_9871/m.30158 type:complete len:253 (-) Transcript_9871:1290-2048(-)